MARLAERSFTNRMTQHTDAQRLTLVVGGTGKTGGRVAQRLIRRGDFADYARDAAATGVWNTQS